MKIAKQIALGCLLTLLVGCADESVLYNSEYKDITLCDVAPIINKSCIRCHNSNGLAPFSFEDGYLLEKKSETILHVLEEKIMPPWKPDPTYRSYKHEYSISAEDREKLATWIIEGARFGESCVDLIELTDNIGFPNRGERFRINDGYTVPENGDHYKCFLFRNPYKKEVVVSALDILPGNTQAIHHISAFLSTDLTMLDSCFSDVNHRSNCDCDYSIDSTSVLISNWAVGASYGELDSTIGFILPENSYLEIQIHFSGGSKGAYDTTSIAFTLADTTNEWRQLYCENDNNFQINIPANEVVIDTLMTPILRDVELRSIWPHTHNIAVEVECWAMTKSGREGLVYIPKWKYKWHDMYEFLEPIELDSGDAIFMKVKFDNTVDNPNNPTIPPRDVYYGRTASDEMLSIVYYLTER